MNFIDLTKYLKFKTNNNDRISFDCILYRIIINKISITYYPFKSRQKVF
jgi:hypothetical protein